MGWRYLYIYILPASGRRSLRSQGNKMRRLRRRTREGCGFSSLMKHKIKAKIYFVICFAGKKNYYFIFTL
jgi:hypothetical protein